MEVFASYFSGVRKVGQLEFFYESVSHKIGVRNIESKTSIAPFLDYAMTFNNYILVKVNDCWGLIDREFRTIIPTLFTHLYPVSEINTATFVENAKNNTIPENTIFKSYNDNGTVRFFLLQKEYKSSSLGSRLLWDHPLNKNSNTDRIFEIVNIENQLPTHFIAEDSEGKYIISFCKEHVMKFWHKIGTSLFQISHYMDEVFMCYAGTFSIAVYNRERGFIHQVIRKIPRGNNSFVHDTSFSDYKSYRNGLIAIKKQRWGLYYQSRLNAIGSICFHRLIDFCFYSAPIHLEGTNTYICSISNRTFLLKYDASIPSNTTLSRRFNLKDRSLQQMFSEYEKNNSNELFEEIIRASFSNKCIIISPYYEEIILREDGNYNIRNKEGWGILDSSMNQIIQPQYYNMLDELSEVLIVEKQGTGVISKRGKCIVPCEYDNIQIGNDSFEIWSSDWDYDYELEEIETFYYIKNKISTSIDIEKDFAVAIKRHKEVADCDIFDLKGVFLCSGHIKHSGGIFLSADTKTITIYESADYDDKNHLLKHNVSLYSYTYATQTKIFENAQVIDEHYFAVLERDLKVGVKNFSNLIGWIIPPKYDFFIVLSHSNVVGCTYNQEMYECVLYKLDKSAQVITEFSIPEKEYIGRDVFVRKVINVLIEDVKYDLDEKFKKTDIPYSFPIEETYDNYYDKGYESYSIEDSLRDAFEDDPEAIWGILD